MKFVACAQLGAAHYLLIGPILLPGQSLLRMAHLKCCARPIDDLNHPARDGDSPGIHQKGNVTFPGWHLVLRAILHYIAHPQGIQNHPKRSNDPSKVSFQNRSRLRNVGVSKSLCDSSSASGTSAATGWARSFSASASRRTPPTKSDA